MSWDSLIAFVEAEAPSFIAALKGASPEDIARVEEDYRVRLPDHYRRFLLLMGEDGAGFHLFGASQNQRFADLVSQLPDDSYPMRQYFKIAYAVNQSMVSQFDHFLDLMRSDGADAPIVMFEPDDEFTPEAVQDRGFTFLEQAYRRLFAHLADERLPERTLFAIPNPSVERGRLSIDAVVAVLGQMHFTIAVEPVPRVSCLRREDMWAQVAVHLDGRGFAVSLWSSERPRLEAVADQLLIRFPDASARNRGRLQKP